MKYFVLAPLVLFFFNAVAQTNSTQSTYPVGSSEETIRNEFIDFNFQTNYTKDGIKFLSATDAGDTLTYYYYFNKKDTCYRYVVVPLNNGTLNNLIQRCNTSFQIINDKEWKKNQSNGKVIDIQLICPDANGCFFLYQ